MINDNGQKWICVELKCSHLQSKYCSISGQSEELIEVDFEKKCMNYCRNLGYSYVKLVFSYTFASKKLG